MWFGNINALKGGKSLTDLLEKPPSSCHFEVSFLMGGIVPNPLDIAFRKISGLSVRIETVDVREGGRNLSMIRLPDQVTHENLVLERGFVIGSLLNMEFQAAMGAFRFFPSNVLVALKEPGKGVGGVIAGWLFRRAYPVAWDVSDLDSDDNRVLVDVMELAYSHFYSLRI